MATKTTQTTKAKPSASRAKKCPPAQDFPGSVPLETSETGSQDTDRDAIADFSEGLLVEEPNTETVAGPTLNLEAILTLQNVVKLYEEIKLAYSAHNAIEIDASHVSSIDTATLQLLAALKKDAVNQQKEVLLVAPSARFIESAELLGLLETLGIDA